MPPFSHVCRTVLNLSLYRTATWFEPVMVRPEHAVKPLQVFPTWSKLASPLYVRQEITVAQKRIVDCQRFSASWFASMIPAFFIVAGRRDYQLCRKALQMFSSQADPEVPPEIRRHFGSIRSS